MRPAWVLGNGDDAKTYTVERRQPVVPRQPRDLGSLDEFHQIRTFVQEFFRFGRGYVIQSLSKDFSLAKEVMQSVMDGKPYSWQGFTKVS